MVSLAGATKDEHDLDRGGIVSVVPQEREVDIIILARYDHNIQLLSSF